MLIVDSDVHSAQALARLMELHGYPAPVLASSVWKAMESVEDSLPDVVVFSLYYPNVDPLLFCRALKQAHPLLPIMVITSPGASLGEIETLGVLAGGLDAVLEQPLDEARFFAALEEVLAKRKLLSPSSVREAAQAISFRHSSVELAARTILFTDVRGSTQLLEATTTQTFFEVLNHKLTQQCAAVRQFSGDIVKFTGDGLMASFQGFDRLTQAFQCALKILELEKAHADQHLPMPVGQGLCDGLVVCAFVGGETRAAGYLRPAGAPGGAAVRARARRDFLHEEKGLRPDRRERGSPHARRVFGVSGCEGARRVRTGRPACLHRAAAPWLNP